MKRDRNTKAQLVSGPVRKILVKLTTPMIFGTLSIVLFNLVDTFFVGQLGTPQLAALSFTFPVVLVVTSLALGMGVGRENEHGEGGCASRSIAGRLGTPLGDSCTPSRVAHAWRAGNKESREAGAASTGLA